MVKKIPKTIYPHRAEQQYAKKLKKHFSELGEYVVEELSGTLSEIDYELKKQQIREDVNISQRIKNIFKKIRKQSLEYVDEKKVSKESGQFVKNISAVNKSNVAAQERVKGINPIDNEPWLKSYMDEKNKENVGYISSIRDETLDKFEEIVKNGVKKGQSAADIKDALVERSGISENRAAFIARDQTGSILGQMNAKRHAQSGIKAYRWRDSDDLAVRDSHAERDGKIYFYADGELLPGEDYNCRCVAEPVFDDELVAAGLLEPDKVSRETNQTENQSEELASKEIGVKQKIEKIKSTISDVPDEASIKEAGKIIEDEFKKATSLSSRAEKIAEAQKDYEEVAIKEIVTERENTQKIKDKYKQTVIELEDQYEDGLINVNEYNKRLSEATELRNKELDEYKEKNPRKSDELKKICDDMRSNLYYDNAEDVKQIFAKIRPMGSDGIDIKTHLSGSKSGTAKLVANAYNHYPSEWVEKSVSYNKLKVKKVKRGFYRHYEKNSEYAELTLSGEGQQGFIVAIHELGHRMERVVDGLIGIEKIFYDRRTKGELLKWMGAGYRKDEKSRKDDFLDIYMGKDYGGRAYELVSMGLEKLYTDPETLMKDKDMFRWICGILALM
ncbi:minor capsid protein [Desemzia sp. C1]|uniref:phage head morphogenesis protein n=1 Tax=Desemzia sp. C1 TaxID=2892016 RepID=UPI001E4BCEB5|nr:minor capsid protein [Desemzia sp. C1]MCI3027699.1 minor capsid protein [Desemzia sp. C1]